MSDKVLLKFKLVSDKFSDIPLPSYSTEGSSGMDIRAAINDSIIIEPGTIHIIPTNLQVEIPEGFELQIRPRSGLAAKYGITLLNSPGTIDSDYRGEIKIIITNLGSQPFTIKRGDRIAQMILTKFYKANIEIVEELTESHRGNGGFGHTGI
jgi:dUTP pyrophosphatase